MIRGCLIYLVFSILIPFKAEAEEHRKPSGTVEGLELSADSVPFDTFLEQAAAVTSQASVFNWRASSGILTLMSGQSIEMNNFNNASLGLRLRLPMEDWLWSLSLKQTWVSPTEGSKVIGQTPYRQNGRPSRYDFSMGGDFPLIEGVGSQRFSWMPRAQFVLSGVAEFEMSHYKGMGRGKGIAEKIKSFVTPNMSDEDYNQVQKQAPAGMRVDRSRMDVGVGIACDLMHHSGVNVGFRNLWHNALGTGSKLGPWRSMSLELGYGF